MSIESPGGHAQKQVGEAGHHLKDKHPSGAKYSGDLFLRAVAAYLIFRVVSQTDLMIF